MEAEETELETGELAIEMPVSMTMTFVAIESLRFWW